MHLTAMKNGENFFNTYSSAFFNREGEVVVIDIGAQDINGSLRSACPSKFKYIGVDFQAGKGVDIVISDPYVLPFDSESVDIVVSSSCLEHSEMFWLTFLEVLRVLKPSGLFYINVPSDGAVHRYPVDCWRFYPDSGKALVAWAHRNGIDSLLLESYTQIGGSWHDFVGVFLKDASQAHVHRERIINRKSDFENGYICGSDKILNPQTSTQNERKMLPRTIRELVHRLVPNRFIHYFKQRSSSS